MPKKYDHLEEFLISKDDGRSTITVFTASPTPLEEKNLGVLFAVLEIDSNDEINTEILDLIIEEIDSHYYQSESFEVETAFEHALQKTNHRLQELIGEVGDEWLQNVNIVVGVQKDEQLVFANIGRVIALMVYNGNIVDVLDTTRAKAEEINPVKIFSNTVAGEISADNIIFFATESILDYLSREKIKRILLENDADTAIRELYMLLEDDTTNTNFGAIIMRKQKKAGLQTNAQSDSLSTDQALPKDSIAGVQGQSPNGLGPQERGVPDSMSELLGRQSRTEELLTSSIWPSLKKRVRDTSQQLLNRRKPHVAAEEEEFFEDKIMEPEQSADEYTRPTPLAKQPTLSRPSGATQAGNVALKIAKVIGKGLIILLNGIKQGVLGLFSMLKQATGRGGRRTSSSRSVRSVSSFNTSASRGITRAIQWFGRLTGIQKTFLILAIGLLLVFAQSVINNGEESTITVAEEENYDQKMQDIEAKINEGKAAVLYDEESARKLLIEARDMLAAVPQESDAYKERGSELAGTIDNQLKRVNNVITLDNPAAVVDFQSVNPQVQVGKMILLGASMYGFDANNTSVYRGNLETKEVSVAINEPGNGEKFVAAAKASPGTGVVKLSNDKFAIFNPVSESLENLDLQYPEGKHAIADISVFGSRLYTLDPKTNDIYKHSQETDGTFGSGTGWLNDKDVSLENALSFAIDGNIYVLKKDGAMIRLSAGAKDAAFTLTAIDPALQSPTKVYTDENSDHLFVLDPSNKRVVEFDKEGKLVVQYMSNSFGDLRDMIVDEPNKKMYVLSGTQVFEIEIQDAPSAEQPANG